MPESMENEFMKRGFLLPEGCKDLSDAWKYKGQKYSFTALPLILPDAFVSPAKKAKVGTYMVTVSQLAKTLGLKPFQLIAELIKAGIFVNPNSILDFKTAAAILRKYGFLPKKENE
jgi:hypothetical protein